MNSVAIRPGWNPLSVGLMVLGFLSYWPLGLAMLAYILWGDRMHGALDGARRSASSLSGLGASKTGNRAFDAYREAELKRLDEERRRLNEERQEFEQFLERLHHARDREEFERFMAERRGRVQDAEVI